MSAQRVEDRQGRSRTADAHRERLLAGLPVTERRLAVAGVSTAVLEGGHGPPVVFLQAEFAAVWMRVIPELVGTHRVIAPDLPGLGASQMSNGPPDVDTVLTWVGELIEQTCPTRPCSWARGQVAPSPRDSRSTDGGVRPGSSSHPGRQDCHAALHGTAGVGDPAARPRPDQRSDDPHLGPARSRSAAGRRQGRRRTLRLAAARHRGRPRRPCH